MVVSQVNIHLDKDSEIWFQEADGRTLDQTLDRMRMKKNKKAGIRLVWWKEARATEKQCYDTSLAVGENE